MKCFDMRLSTVLLLPPPDDLEEVLDCEAVPSSLAVPCMPDRVLARIVQQGLNERCPSAFGRVESRVHTGHVCLEGQVPTFYLKQLAQHIAMQTPGVERVTNHLQVVSALPSPSDGRPRYRNPVLLCRTSTRRKSVHIEGECHGSGQSD